MNGRLLAGFALGASLLVAPSAQATDPDVIHGDCFFTADNAGTASNSAYDGVIGDASVTTTGDTPPAPIGATVTCDIEVNGVVAAGTSHSYGDRGVAGVQFGTDQISYVANPGDSVAVCTSVSFADNSTTSFCQPDADRQLKDTIGQLIDGWCFVVCPDTLDRLLCPEFASLAGSYGPIAIKPDGDIAIEIPDPLGLGLNSPIYDCPPYGNGTIG